MRKISHKYHLWAITFLIFVIMVIGVLMGINTYGDEYFSHPIEITSIALLFVNTTLLLVVVGILVKMEYELHQKIDTHLTKKRKRK